MQKNNILIALALFLLTFVAEADNEDSAELVARYPQLCSLAQESIKANQSRLNAYPSEAGLTYQQLIDELNQKIARYALFNGIKTLINNYHSLANSLQSQLDTSETLNIGTIILAQDNTGIEGITNIIMVEQAISSILGSSISMQQLAQFPFDPNHEGGTVCPSQDLTQTTLVSCPDNQKTSALYLALSRQCQSNDEAQSRKPLCRTLKLLERPANRVARQETIEMLENFRRNYNNAYLIESGQKSTITDPTADMQTLLEQLHVFSAMGLYENGKMFLFNDSLLTDEQKSSQGAEPDVAIRKSGLDLLVDQAESVFNLNEVTDGMFEQYTQCIASIDPVHAAEALCGIRRNISRCEHAVQITPQRLTWMRTSFERCQQCYRSDASLCLTPEALSEYKTILQVETLPANGLLGLMQKAYEHFTAQVSSVFSSSPLARQLYSEGLSERAPVRSADEATRVALARLREETTNSTGQGSRVSRYNEFYLDITQDETLALRYLESNNGNTTIDASSFQHNLYTADNETARIFRTQLRESFQAFSNEGILLRGAQSGQSLDAVRGQLEGNATPASDSHMYHKMLSELLSLTANQTTGLNLDCFKSGTTRITQSVLDAGKENLEEMGRMMHQCISEIGTFRFADCNATGMDQAQRSRCETGLQNNERFQQTYSTLSSEIYSLEGKISRLHRDAQFSSLFDGQQTLFALAQRTCRDENAVSIVQCRQKSNNPIGSSEGISFLLNQSREIIGYIDGYEQQDIRTLRLISSIQRNCPRSGGEGRVPNMPICSFRSRAIGAQTMLATNNLQSIAPAFVSESAHRYSGSEEANHNPSDYHETSRRSRDSEEDELSRLERNTRRPASFSSIPSNSGYSGQTNINNLAGGLGSYLGSNYYSGYGNTSMNMPFNFNGLTGMGYSFPIYPGGYFSYNSPFSTQLFSPLGFVR